MNPIEKFYKKLYPLFLSENSKKNSEKIILGIAIISFAIHSILILLIHYKIVILSDYDKLLSNPIAAIYTPFSFILLYEVYLLVYYLPKSTSSYIGKQYEIITLILIRRIFKDLSKLEFTANWFTEKNDLQFTYDLLATIILFGLIFLFYKLNRKEAILLDNSEKSIQMESFIKTKKIIAFCLIPILIILASTSLINWIYDSFFSISELVESIKNVNSIFFDEFFTVLILIDVLLLLVSFLHTDKFNQVIRNSGFIISTILIKMSFATEGLLNTVLIVVAVLFGVLILAINNLYEKSNIFK